jgi:hypothetical protein
MKIRYSEAPRQCSRCKVGRLTNRAERRNGELRGDGELEREGDGEMEREDGEREIGRMERGREVEMERRGGRGGRGERGEGREERRDEKREKRRRERKREEERREKRRKRRGSMHTFTTELGYTRIGLFFSSIISSLHPKVPLPFARTRTCQKNNIHIN